MLSVLTGNINQCKGVGPKRAKLYEKLGVTTVYSLLTFFPRDYIDFTHPKPIAQALVGETCAIRAKVYKKAPEQRIRKGMTLYKVFVTDGGADLAITIFNNKYGYQALKLEQEYYFYGKIGGNFVRREMNAPMVLPAGEPITMQPVYPLTEGLTSKMVITNQKEALRLVQQRPLEFLPRDLIETYDLCSWAEALQLIHFPQNHQELQRARKRLVFEELLTWQLGLGLMKKKRTGSTKVQLLDWEMEPFVQALPFRLTGAQVRVIKECMKDFRRLVPMNRLVQGDVGSGKTMVAAALCYLMAKNGYQSAMMAPTEILADQHLKTLQTILEPLGVTVRLLTGRMTKKQKDALKQELAEGSIDVLVGTHALVQDSTIFRRLGLVVTDEQHRFGVNQRQRLAEKGDQPHVLVMSATPIPRTLAMIVYGDLDISVLDELPKGRQKIATYAIPAAKRMRAFAFIKRQLDQGRQAYIVCPAIEEGEREVASVTSYAQKLTAGPFRGYRVGVLHGKMENKEQTMQRFSVGEIQLLVCTTVVEVGVDVPNATVMMIENAELFGLSQLHQLRGRVGRGRYASSCILVSDLATDENKKRLRTLCTTSDGFAIAQQDLHLRGPGDFFGKRQHGLPQFRIADMVDDMQVLQTTQELSRRLLEQDPTLSQPEHRGLRWLVAKLLQENYYAV